MADPTSGAGPGAPAVVKSADRTLAILDLLTVHREGLTLVDIQRTLGFPKSSTYSLLMTMVGRGFLEQDADSRRFRVGIRLWQAGQSYVAAEDLEAAALPYMEQLRDELNEVVQLATLDGTDNVYLGKVDPDQQLRLASRVGARLPAYATGIGKALLTQLDDAEIERRFAAIDFTRYTAHTIGSCEQLLATVDEFRRRGYATDTSEYTPGVCCVAAAIPRARAGQTAAISVSVPEVRWTDDLMAHATEAVQATARKISERMGYEDNGARSADD
jgi:IclR family transcriptional regulator, KDG regulon repressor